MDSLIVSIPREKGSLLGRIVNDDLVSRQTIAVREAKGLDIESEDTYVLVEGSEESIRKLRDIIGEDGRIIEGDEKESIHHKIKEAEDQIAEGLGMMFGD